ncbi:MAG: hypothetical protein CR997_09490 [Acidobacteria bacterium]|nr:MAG: hypothetical protein CR997_09490 [Acidobacteriota bacterium]
MPNMYKRKRSFKIGKLKFVFFTVILLAVGYFSFNYYLDKSLEKGNAALLSGDLKKAELYYLKVTRLPFSNGKGHDGLGAVALLQNRHDEAKNHFQVVLANKTNANLSNIQTALNVFITRGDYEAGKTYRDFLLQWLGTEVNQFNIEYAALSLGNFELAQARQFLSNTPEEQKQSKPYQRILSLADEYENNEEVPILYDRDGDPIMVFNLNNSQYEYVTPQLFYAWPKQEDYGNKMDRIDWKNKVFTTIDLDLQRVAHQAMKGYEGSLILMHAGSGEIVAAYGTKGFSPFETEFEPGSVIKVLTYAAFLEENGNSDAYAPKNYPGNTSISGKVFYDWKTHGQLNSIGEGMAVSCNLMFAQMGVDMGWVSLRKMYNRFFDRKQTDFLLGKMMKGQILETPTNDYEIARMAIGLDGIASTVRGLIQIPAAIANKGVCPSPVMVSRCETIHGQVYKKATPENGKKVFQTTTATELMDSMKLSLSFDQGTARRAAVEGVEAAMKTGTAGERPFDSVMIGVLNPSKPQLVFAFHLYKGGKCEINGALVASRLQSQIKVIAPQFLQ